MKMFIYAMFCALSTFIYSADWPWIDVNERLPKRNEYVAFAWDGTRIYDEDIKYSHETQKWEYTRRLHEPKITHWLAWPIMSTNNWPWIDVKERLPKSTEYITFASDGKEIFDSEIRYYQGKKIWEYASTLQQPKITYWLPYPSNPKENTQ